MQIKIVVATHKAYQMPQDAMYLPVHAGRANHPQMLEAYQGDNSGENISAKNPNYCELTCLYWAWKNLDADYIGLVHYRRHLRGKRTSDKWAGILTQKQAEAILQHTDVILPKKRDYFIESTYNQYIHAHHKEDLDQTYAILKAKYPQYLPAWDKVMQSTAGHRFNMFVMRKDILDKYCTWLFDVLFQLEETLDISQYSQNDSRVFGFVSERLLDVWLITNHISYQECAVINMEKQHWLKKGTNFLKRKFMYKGE